MRWSIKNVQVCINKEVKMRSIKVVVLLLAVTMPAWALNWQNTGNLDKALYAYDLLVGPGGWLYVAAKIDTASFDSGWVFVSQDLFNWQRGGDLSGDVKAVYSLINIGADTIMAGTRGGTGATGEPDIFTSSDRGQTWVFRSLVTGTRVGPAVRSLLKDRNGIIHAGHNYGGMTGYPPCRSTDQGLTWSQGPRPHIMLTIIVCLRQVMVLYIAEPGQRVHGL